MEVKRKYPAHSKRPAAPGVATLLPFNSSAATAHPSPTPRRLSRRLDRKSTRLNSKSLRHLVCRLLLEKKKVSFQPWPPRTYQGDYLNNLPPTDPGLAVTNGVEGTGGIVTVAEPRPAGQRPERFYRGI